MPSRPRAKPRAPEPLNAEPAYGFRAWRGTIGGPHATHTHADVEWNLLLGGAARYFIAGQFRPLPVGRLVVFWGAIPHRIVDWTAGATMLWVTLPIGWFLGWGLGDAIVTRMLGGGLIAEPDAARGPADEALIDRWAVDLASDVAGRRKAALFEVQARPHRLAVDVPAAALPVRRRRPSVADEPGAGGHVERISAFVARHFRDDGLDVAAVARGAGLHPNYAMAVFKQGCGMSLWEYVTRLRVSHAQRLLLTTDRKVTAVALDSGFRSVSRFYDAFTRVAGRPPRGLTGRRSGGRCGLRRWRRRGAAPRRRGSLLRARRSGPPLRCDPA